MSETDLAAALTEVADRLADPATLIRVVAGGRRRGQPSPEPAKLTGRVVQLKTGVVLQLSGVSGPRVTTINLDYADPDAFRRGLESALAQPYANWRVERTDGTVQVRMTKKGRAFVHRGPAQAATVPSRDHDNARERLIDPDDPLFAVLGADAAKRRQVDAFLRSLAATLSRAEKRKALPDGPLHAVDLGCGNAYLTLAAHRYLTEHRPGSTTTGVELRADLVARSQANAARAGLAGISFVTGTIGDAVLEAPPSGRSQADVVLALHACDTATDDALARAVRWQAPVVLAAPCCHHAVQQQVAAELPHYPPAQRALISSPILRERFCDVLTDSLRAAVLRRHGYRVDVVEFVDSRHTPRNLMIRAVRTGQPATPEQLQQLEDLITTWQVRPVLAGLLGEN